VPAIAGIGDDAGQRDTDLAGDRRHDGGQRVAIIGVAWQSRDMGNEPASATALQRRGERDLDAELIEPVRLDLADAFHLRGVQAVDLAPARPLALVAHPGGQ